LKAEEYFSVAGGTDRAIGRSQNASAVVPPPPSDGRGRGAVREDRAFVFVEPRTQAAGRCAFLALRWKKRAWLITAETIEGSKGLVIRKVGSGRSPVR
jgi:hypothetical protein